MTDRKGSPLALKGHKRTLRRNLPNVGDSIAYQKEGVTVTACNDNNVVVIAHLHLSSPDDLVTCERQIGREKRTITQPKSVRCRCLSGEIGESRYHQREEAATPTRG